MSEEHARLVARISGRVQGVGYRFFTVDEATARNLVGFCRNVPGGDVEVVAEGPRAILEDFLHALAQGPRASRVTTVKPLWESTRGEFADFGVHF